MRLAARPRVVTMEFTVARRPVSPSLPARPDALAELASTLASKRVMPPGDVPVGVRPTDLHTLGAESSTGRSVKKVVPWLVSVGVHLAMILLGFVVTWTVVMARSDREPVTIVADFSDMMYEPLARMTEVELPETDQLVQDRAVIETPSDRIAEPVEIEIEPAPLFTGFQREPEPTRFAARAERPSVTFVGLSTTNARRIVYVIDASGSMIKALPIVLEELARSLDGLVPEQEFTVIFFTRNTATIVPPARRLIPATAAEKQRVLAWIAEHVIPAGRSNPLAAIQAALEHRPDVIFMLSENITGSGEFEIDQRDLLSLLDTLNPHDPRTGRRATRINCVQFLDPDPLQTLLRIAREHGGEDGYKFLDRSELGLRAR